MGVIGEYSQVEISTKGSNDLDPKGIARKTSNTMTNDMTWGAIAANEGSEIEAISATEAEEVSGGNDWPTYVQVGASVVALAAAAYITWKK